DYAQKLASGEIESGKGANHIRNVQRACDTRWSSHLSSVASLIHLYGPSCRVLENVQIEEIRARFDDKVLELLKLSSSLDPRDGYKAFNIGAICDLAQKYYPLDFSEKDLDDLKFELKHFHADAPTHPELQNLSSLAELCHGLAVTGKSTEFNLVDRLIRLILTLPVSTATGERAFSAMKIVKNRLRNKMNDDFLADNLVIFIELEIAETFSLDAILSDFSDLKEHRALLKYN
ncbi:unnamed protein product, partial [Linum tenue]